MMSSREHRRVPARAALVALIAVVAAAAGTLLLAAFDPPAASAAPPRDTRSANDARTPSGEMNLAWSEPGLIGVVGWAKDPDVNRPIQVVVATDNPPSMVVRTAGVYNPFLPGKYAEKFRSFLVAVPVPPGPTTMCVAALNVGKGNPFRLLGCKSFAIESPDPIGAVDDMSIDASGEGLAIRGWALDPETAFPLPVTVTVDGVAAGRLVASDPRADIGATRPASGPLHGFSGTVPISPGRRQVCAVAQNIGRGVDRFVGCRTIDVPAVAPLGAVEEVSTRAAGIRVSGWAGDPEAASIGVRVDDWLVGEADDPAVRTVNATIVRDDVAASTGLSRTNGFDTTIPVTTPGDHNVCVTALNVARGRDRSLGCFLVRIADQRPIGSVDAVVPAGNGVRVHGWAVQPRSLGTAVDVRITVDGSPTNLSTSGARADVGALFPAAGGNAGFDTTIGGLSNGRHTVCVTFTGVGGAVAGAVTGDRSFACGTVVVGPTAVGTTGGVGGVIPVGTTGPLSDVDRDAGVTTTLRDGSVLWLFGDSVALNPDGSLRYFVSGTGAWASASSPTYTRDAVAPGSVPYLLATPGASFPACDASMPHRAMWPLSAVTVPSGPLDHVIVFMANMCLRDGMTFSYRGVAVAEWYYDPAAPPVERPVQLTVVNPSVGLARSWGTASVVGADGFLYLYQCDRPANPADVGNYGPCRVARVAPAAVADTAQYRYWNGSSWSPSDPSVSMNLPPGSAVGFRYPASSFTVAWDAPHGVYVMVYSPWPGFVDRLAVRVARSPEGPWSEPAELTLPGCSDTVSGQTKSCYAGTAQPWFSTATELGVGFYDQATPADRRRGRYQVARVPFVTVLS